MEKIEDRKTYRYITSAMTAVINQNKTTYLQNLKKLQTPYVNIVTSSCSLAAQTIFESFKEKNHYEKFIQYCKKQATCPDESNLQQFQQYMNNKKLMLNQNITESNLHYLTYHLYQGNDIYSSILDVCFKIEINHK